MSIASEITRLQNAKEAIKTSLTNKGITVPDNTTLEEYSTLIDSIESGSSLDTSQFRRTSYLFYENRTIEEAPLFDTSNVTDFSFMFYNCTNLEIAPDYNTSKATTLARMFAGCDMLKKGPNFDTGAVTDMSYMFSMNYYISGMSGALQQLPEYDAGKVINIYNFLGRASNNWSYLTTFGGLKDLGKSYTKTTENYQNYELDLDRCTALTHDSLMNVINKLYDLNLTYGVANGGTLYKQSLILGSENLAKLTDDEIAIATSKGWNVS